MMHVWVFAAKYGAAELQSIALPNNEQLNVGSPELINSGLIWQPAKRPFPGPQPEIFFQQGTLILDLTLPLVPEPKMVSL